MREPPFHSTYYIEKKFFVLQVPTEHFTVLKTQNNLYNFFQGHELCLSKDSARRNSQAKEEGQVF